MPDSEQHVARNRRLTIAAVLLIAIGNAVAIAVPAGIGWDFANFYDTGRRVAVGEVGNLYDPGAPIAGQPPQGELGFYGTPLSAYLFVPMAGLSPRWALVVFKLENAVALLVALYLLFALHRRLVDRSAAAQWRFAATFAVAALIYQPLWTIYRVGGQTTPTVFLLLTVVLVFHTAGRYGRSAAAFAMAIVIKPALVTGLAFLFVGSGVSFMIASVAAGGVLGAASVLAMGWPIHAVFVDRMLASANLVWPWFYNSSLFILVDNLRRWFTGDTTIGVGEGLFGWALLALRVAVLVLFVRLMLAARRYEWRRPAGDHFRVLMAIAFFLLISQTVWEHYLTFLFPMLVYCLAMRPVLGSGFNRLVVAIIVASIGQSLIVVNVIRNVFAFDSLVALLAIGLLKSGPLLCTVALLTRYRRELLDSYAGAAWQAFSSAAPR